MDMLESLVRSSDTALWEQVLASAVISTAVMVRALKRRSVDRSGAISGWIVGFVSFLAGYAFGVTLLFFFFAGTKATVYRQEEKRKIEEDFKEGGSRDWKQVLANGGVPTLIAALLFLRYGVAAASSPISSAVDKQRLALVAAFVSYYACCCADTLSSEIGVLSRSDPVLITAPWRRVPRGTNGGVSLLGFLAAAGGGLLIGVPVAVGQRDARWLLLSTAAGLLGTALDSLLGATLQFSGQDTRTGRIVSRRGPHVRPVSGLPGLDNNQVNLVSASLVAAMGLLLAPRWM